MAVYLGEDKIGVIVPASEDIIQLNINQMKTVDLVYNNLNGMFTIASDEEYVEAEEYFQELASAILGVEDE